MIESFIQIIFLLLVIAFFFWAIFTGGKFIFLFIFHDFIGRYYYSTKQNERYKPYLQKHSEFYNHLNEANQKLFEYRVGKFIRMKQFIPRGELKEITDKMKSMIAAAAVQITFGYPDVYFDHFWRILVYPDTYHSTITKKKHYGEINLTGIIVFSWKKFKEGYENYSDGKNLGLHEMAHAFIIENKKQNQQYNFINDDLLKIFDLHYNHEKENMEKNPNSFFRKYGSVNEHEFFSVVVENFFERPAKLYEYNPKLYALTAKLLKVNALKPNQIIA